MSVEIFSTQRDMRDFLPSVASWDGYQCLYGVR